MLRIAWLLLTVWSCVFAQALPAVAENCAAVKQHCCGHCQNAVCECSHDTAGNHTQQIPASDRQDTARRLADGLKVVTDWVGLLRSAAAAIAPAHRSDYHFRASASPERPLFARNCSFLI